MHPGVVKANLPVEDIRYACVRNLLALMGYALIQRVANEEYRVRDPVDDIPLVKVAGRVNIL